MASLAQDLSEAGNSRLQTFTLTDAPSFDVERIMVRKILGFLQGFDVRLQVYMVLFTSIYGLVWPWILGIFQIYLPLLGHLFLFLEYEDAFSTRTILVLSTIFDNTVGVSSLIITAAHEVIFFYP